MLRSMVALLSGALCSAAYAEDEVSLSLEGEFSIELMAHWDQLTDTVYKFEQQYDLVQNLTPAHESLSYREDVFRAFLPDKPVKVGEAWKLDPRLFTGLLAQLHPGATHELHHAAGGRDGVAVPGAWGCLRAIGSRYADVRLRVHPDFLLEGDGSRGGSSWLTPAQFAGTLIIDREKQVVVSFELALPDQSANVDINIASELGIIADIGRIPRMELRSRNVASPEVSFEHEIEDEEVDALLEKAFYPIAKFEWFELEEAFEEALASGRPLHVVALFGSLMDESC